MRQSLEEHETRRPSSRMDVKAEDFIGLGLVPDLTTHERRAAPSDGPTSTSAHYFR
jgi:hypothetical protein